MTRKKHSYHHGNLRPTLLEAGIALLETRGLEGLSLRQVAASAGVSHAAPAHYFPSLKHLLTALAAIGFERFDTAMRLERNVAAKSAAQQLQAAAMGYAKFAAANPGLFRLMFSKALLDASDPILRQHANAAFAQLEAICAPLLAMLAVEAGDAGELQKLVWSAAHGYAHLYIEGQMQQFDADTAHSSGDLRPPNLAQYLFKEPQQRRHRRPSQQRGRPAAVKRPKGLGCTRAAD
jgi:AcrR family transcriptional regulator